MVEQESLLEMRQRPSVGRFINGASERGLPPEDATDMAIGCFNRCVFYDKQGVVLRFPKTSTERAVHTGPIRQELASIGPGIGFELRSQGAQIKLTREVTSRGLLAPEIVDTFGGAVLMKKVDGMTLDKYVQQDPAHINPQVIEKVITHQTESHRQGIVIGDRWNANTMVTDDESMIVELDYDIRLIGERLKTRAFELAQNLYHLVHFSAGHRDFMVTTILNVYDQDPYLLSAYNMRDIRLFLHSQAQYHHKNFADDGALYENFVPPHDEIYKLIDGMEKIKNAPPKLFVARNTLRTAA